MKFVIAYRKVLLTCCMLGLSILVKGNIQDLQRQLEQQIQSQGYSYKDTFTAEFTLRNNSDDDLEVKFSLGNIQRQQCDLLMKSGAIKRLYTGQYTPRHLLSQRLDYTYFNFTIRAREQIRLQLSAWNLSRDDYEVIPMIDNATVNVIPLVKWFRISPLGVLMSVIFLGGVFMFMIYFLAISFSNPQRYRWYYILHLFFVFIFYLVYLDHVFQINLLFPYNSYNAAKLLEFLRLPVLAFYLYFFSEILGLKKRIVNYNLIFLGLIFIAYIVSLWFFNDLSFILNKLFALYVVLYLFSFYTNFQLYKRWRGKLKNYIVPGAMIFGLFVLPETLQILLSDFHYLLDGYYIKSLNIFSFNLTQFGILVSLIFFSIAIGYKQREVLQERNDAQKNFIGELEKNQILQKQLNANLRSEIEVTNDALTKKEAEILQSGYENKILQLESKILSSQLNPHFIFNNLNAIKYYTMVKNPEETGKYISTFSKIMRMILSNANKKVITLFEEMKFVEMYLDIERTRFEEKFDYEIKNNAEVSLEQIKIPPMITQPFIEDALWHGLMHKEDKGLLKIELNKVGEDVRISIRDNGPGRQASTKKGKNITKDTMGSEMNNQRIKVFNDLYKVNIVVTTEDLYDEQGAIGTEVVISVPPIPQSTLNI